MKKMLKSNKKLKIPNLDEIFQILKIKPKDKMIYRRALTHKTWANEHKDSKSYEVLEFLGDAILQMKTSLFIYNQFPNENEEKFSLIRKQYVSSSTLSKIVVEHKLNEYLFLSNDENLRQNEKICSDIFESLLAAIYFDLGDKEAENFLERFLYPLIRKSSINELDLKDPKTKLQELLQPISKEPVKYKTTLINENAWEAIVMSHNCIYGKGQGKSKQEAETQAAMDALNKWSSKNIK